MKYAIFIFFVNISCSAFASVDVKISLNEKATRGVTVMVSIANDLGRKLCINSAALGLDGQISDPIFVVEKDGEGVDFSGIREIRSIQPERSYVILMPGQEIKVSHDLSNYYNFLVPGNYKIRFETLSIGNCPGESGGVELKSNSVYFFKK